MERDKVVYALAFLLRLVLLSLPSVAAVLAERVELSTPITSFKRCMH
jgi:hypothetical protein